MLIVQNVSKAFQLYKKPSDRLFDSLRISKQSRSSEFWALRNVSFTVEKGEFVAIVGPNGCGKSTLLQVVSGILQPTEGRVVTRGRVAAILELGAGFNPEFTGRENVMINGELMGLDDAELQRALPGIEEFAGIGTFIDRPVKEYSSGMYIRLAFATAIHVNPEILIVDEALSVGDAAFANRCIRKFQELRDQGVTVLFVSHDMGLVKQLSDRAVFLLNGTLQAIGEPRHVIDRYIATVLHSPEDSFGATINGSGNGVRHGDCSTEISGAVILNESGEPCTTIESGQLVQVRISVRVHQAVSDPQIGILIRSNIGMDVYGTNTRIENTRLGEFSPGNNLIVDFRFHCWLTPQQYSLTVATQHADGSSHDWRNDMLVFDVVSLRHAAGVADLRSTIQWRMI